MSETRTQTDISLPDLPAQPADTPWPTDEWPTALLDDVPVKKRRLVKLLDQAFADEPPAELGLTRALLVVRHGRIVVERYGPGFFSEFDAMAGRTPQPDGPDTRLTSWSMAKSMLQCALGIHARGGGFRLASRAPVPEWTPHDDPRHFITWHHLLHMASGLSWIEEYVVDRGSDVIQMLFGDGRSDMGAFAAAFPLTAKPGSQFLYSSGTTNILARELQRLLGLSGNADGMRDWLKAELFDPIGMTSAVPDFDESGTWVASSYVSATARDFARFGLLYLRGGTWDGQTIVDRSWVDDARRPIPLPTNHACRYGSHWWIHDDGHGTFACHGYEGQRITCVPDKDLVVVRLGKTPPQGSDIDTEPHPVDVFVDKVIACFENG